MTDRRLAYFLYMKRLTDRFIGQLSDDGPMPRYEIVEGRYVFEEVFVHDTAPEHYGETNPAVIEDSDKQRMEARSPVEIAWDAERKRRALADLEAGCVTFEDFDHEDYLRRLRES